MEPIEMPRYNKARDAVTKFVREHKTKLAVVATATVCLALNRAALKSHNDFLKEHDLYDEYYLETDEDF